jgi:hypothetical protein
MTPVSLMGPGTNVREILIASQLLGPQADEDHLVRYLRAGVPIFPILAAEVDPVRNDRMVVGSDSRLTDGQWFWPDQYTYYVEQYHVRLSPKFIAHARGNNWRVPEISSEERARLYEECRQRIQALGHL